MCSQKVLKHRAPLFNQLSELLRTQYNISTDLARVMTDSRGALLFTLF